MRQKATLPPRTVPTLARYARVVTTTSPHESVPERIDPLREPIGVVSHHLVKYAFARDNLKRGWILDIACGVGYGSAFLADSMGRVIGVDVSNEAVELARSRYTSDNCRFIQGDAQKLPIRAGAFDAVVCFEGIEHFAQPEEHLVEVGRVLRAGGVYLVSTPHPGAHTHGAENPFHLHEFDVTTFRAMLDRFFRSVELLGQVRKRTNAHVIAQRADVLGLRRSRWLRPASRFLSRSVLKTRPTEEARLEDFSIEPWTPEATEYLAVCRDPRI